MVWTTHPPLSLATGPWIAEPFLSQAPGGLKTASISPLWTNPDMWNYIVLWRTWWCTVLPLHQISTEAQGPSIGSVYFGAHLGSAEGKIKKRVKTLVHSHHLSKAALNTLTLTSTNKPIWGTYVCVCVVCDCDCDELKSTFHAENWPGGSLQVVLTERPCSKPFWNIAFMAACSWKRGFTWLHPTAPPT